MPVSRTKLRFIGSIDGVGRSQAARLTAFGLGSVEEVVAAGTDAPSRISSAVPALAAESSSILSQCWFVMLGDLGEKGAAALVAAGFADYADLVAAPAGTVVAALAALRPAPTRRACEELQRLAARAMTMFEVLLLPQGADGPETGVQLFVAGPAGSGATTSWTIGADRSGRLLGPSLSRGNVALFALRVGSGWCTLTVMAGTTNPVQVQTLMINDRAVVAKLDDVKRAAGAVVAPARNVVRVGVASVRGLSVGSLLLIEQMGADRSVLISAVHSRAGDLVVDSVVESPARLIPSGSKVGDVLAVTPDFKLQAADAEVVLAVRRYRERAGAQKRSGK
ncbi:hypothetical protein ACXR2U_13200 [Jatrophihabitans sp. YIM 134969]